MISLSPDVLLATFLAVLGMAVSVVIWAASTHAARVQAREARMMGEGIIDSAAVEQIRRVYESAIGQLESEVERLKKQALQFEQRAISLEAEVRRLRARLSPEGHTDPGIPRIEPGS